MTNLRRAVRPALRIHGQALSETDVSNAQPLILGFIAAKLRAGDWSVDQVRRLGTRGEIDDAFSGTAMTPWSAELPADLVDYLDVCERGEFYQAIAEAWGVPLDTRKQKNEIKRLVFRLILFGRVRPGNQCWQGFKRRWPSVATVLEELKRYDHATTARASQRIESRLMIEGVVGRLRQSHPGVPLLTIHDSVLVTPEAAEAVREAVLAEFGTIGLKPHVKQESQAQQQTETAARRTA